MDALSGRAQDDRDAQHDPPHKAAEETDPERALNLSIEAHGLAPDLVPAASIAGRLLASRGNTPRAAKILQRTWSRAPHPDLATAYAYARTSMWAAARRSDRILTVSEASKRDILSLFNVKPEKIVVVYNAIDEHFSTTPSEEHVARIRERYQLDHKFVLYVGNIKPHKNLVRLIEAFSELRRTHDEGGTVNGDDLDGRPAVARK